MLNDHHLQTRREFLATGIKGLSLVAASGHVPAFLTRTAIAAAPARDAPILVVVQLGGGNDGLNTVIPFANDIYHSSRPTITPPTRNILKLTDQIGLHPSLKAMADLYGSDDLAIVQGVGYPNPDRSHFRSMEIWHTGAASQDDHQLRGWLGRYFDAECSGSEPKDPGDDMGTIGMNFGKVMPQAFRNRSNVGIALDNPDTFRWNPSGETSGLVRAQEQIFARINRPQDGPGQGAMAHGGSGQVPGGVSAAEPEAAEFLRHTAMNAVLSGDQLRAIIGRDKGKTAYPDNGLASQLRMVAQLIGGDFPTRVYYTTQGGYDTHSGQVQTHARLLGELAESIAAFLKDLADQKNAGRVLVMAFSEFGRRVAENASGGTDHGAAAPMFLFGKPARAGLHGEYPDLAQLADGDLQHTVDFRQVYATILDRWLKTDSKAILGREFAKLDIV